MPGSAPTLRSLAKELGLSRTTVSDALRGSLRVDPKTAARVREAAKAAGYQRNPLAGALMSELRRSRGSAFRGVLAAINVTEPRRPEPAGRYHQELTAGAQARAGELGFKLETFTVGTGGITLPRLDSILQSRGIHGVILLPVWEDPDLSHLEWPRYAGVYTDYIIERPALPTVCPDHYRSLILALQRLAALGYRRPGLFLQRQQDERLQGRWTAALRTVQEALPRSAAVPPLLVDTFRADEFNRWFRRHQPDVVLGHHTEAITWMEACGARVPDTHGFFCINLTHRQRACAGLDLQPALLGARAAELVIAQLQRNETGLPEWPTATTLPGRWCDGPTVRPAPSA